MSRSQIYLIQHKIQGQNNKPCTNCSDFIQRHLNTRKNSLINTSGYQYDNGSKKPRRAYGLQIWLIVVFIQQKNESGVPVALVQKKHALLKKKNVDITGIKTKIFRDKYNNCMRNVLCVIFSFYEVPWKKDTNIITIFLIWYYASTVLQIQFWHSTIEASS